MSDLPAKDSEQAWFHHVALQPVGFGVVVLVVDEDSEAVAAVAGLAHGEIAAERTLTDTEIDGESLPLKGRAHLQGHRVC